MEKKAPPATLGKQISLLIEGLKHIKTSSKDPMCVEMLQWVRDLPPHARPPELYEALQRSFGLSLEQLRMEIEPETARKDFDHLVPRKGWLADYIQYTKFTEPPTVFHFFVGANILGSVLKRNVFWQKGSGNLYPNLAVILVAPSGRCRKTTACEIGVKLFREIGGSVMADRPTPEALVAAYGEKDEATGLLYAPELKQFLGSQRYMEGMVPLLTRLLDCPDVWTSATVGRGEITLRNVGFSALGATTMDWLRTLPTDSFGGGFMSRFLLVVQESTPRRFPIPPPLSATLRSKLLKRLVDLTHARAIMKLTPNAEEWFYAWYNKQQDAGPEEKLFSGYFERKPDNLVRMAMVLSVSEDDGFVITRAHLEASLKILNWLEAWLPNAFGQIGANFTGEETIRMISQLKKNGGTMKHSDWLRKNSMRMNSVQFKGFIVTLREAKLVDYDAKTSTYYLTPDGWKS